MWYRFDTLVLQMNNWLSTLPCDRTSMLTHTYPHKTRRKIQVAWPCVWSGDLRVERIWCIWHQIALLREVVKLCWIQTQLYMPSTFDIYFIITGIRMDLESSLKLDKESLESSLERERERLEAEMEEESQRREKTWQRQREELLQEIQSERNALSKNVFCVSPCLSDQVFSMSPHIQQEWNTYSSQVNV